MDSHMPHFQAILFFKALHLKVAEFSWETSDIKYLEFPSFFDEKQIRKTSCAFFIFMLVNDFQVESQKSN